MTSNEETPVRRSTRIADKKKEAAAAPPELQIVSVLDGTQTQKLNQEQKIGFKMEVTLSIAEDSPDRIEELYDLQQQVRDRYRRGDDPATDLTAWDDDGPFGPPYQDPFGGQDGYVGVDNTNIQFEDYPGFTTTAKIKPGEWLHSYEGQFRWIVTRKSDGKTWTSQVVTHTVTSAYNAGKDAPVVYAVGRDRSWRIEKFI